MPRVGDKYRYYEINVNELSALDLHDQIGQLDTGWELYRIEFYDDDNGKLEGQHAEALFIPEHGRIGIAWGGDAQWADVGTANEGIRLWAEHPAEYDANE